MIESLPEPNKVTLEYLMAHLSLVIKHSQDNLMGITSLAMAFESIITKTKLSSPMHALKRIYICEKLLSYYEMEHSHKSAKSLLRSASKRINTIRRSFHLPNN